MDLNSQNSVYQYLFLALKSPDRFIDLSINLIKRNFKTMIHILKSLFVLLISKVFFCQSLERFTLFLSPRRCHVSMPPIKRKILKIKNIFQIKNGEDKNTFQGIGSKLESTFANYWQHFFNKIFVI